MKIVAAAALAVVLLAAPLRAEEPSATHEPLYRKVSPAIVGINAVSKQDGPTNAMTWFGSGTIISEDGVIVTSTTVVPANVDPEKIEVIMPGGKSLKASHVASSNDLELSMIRLPEGKYKFVPLGDSKKLKLGHVVYTFGNCEHTVEVDDQVAVAQGEVSGFYRISDLFEGKTWYEWSTYKGEVVETTAPLNPGVDGGPLISAHGQFVGLMTLSYHESRWLGTAIPVHVLGEKIEKWVKGDVDEPKKEPEKQPENPPAEDEDGWIGVELDGETTAVSELSAKSPAAKAGILIGDRISSVDGVEVKDADALRKAFRGRKPGEIVELTVKRDGKDFKVRVKLGHRPL